MTQGEIIYLVNTLTNVLMPLGILIFMFKDKSIKWTCIIYLITSFKNIGYIFIAEELGDKWVGALMAIMFLWFSYIFKKMYLARIKMCKECPLIIFEAYKNEMSESVKIQLNENCATCSNNIYKDKAKQEIEDET